MSESNALAIVFTGPTGVGKTTALRAIGEQAGLCTERPPGDGAADETPLTTVGGDHGRCRLGDDTLLTLLATPVHARARGMSDTLARGAFGLVVLADNRGDDPVAETAGLLAAFAAQVPQRRTVVGVGRCETHPVPSVDDWHAGLARAGFEMPVLAVDVRRADDVRLLLAVLVAMAEVDDG